MIGHHSERGRQKTVAYLAAQVQAPSSIQSGELAASPFAMIGCRLILTETYSFSGTRGPNQL
jgi:hypothetical protein